jgi:hypothetical protein
VEGEEGIIEEGDLLTRTVEVGLTESDAVGGLTESDAVGQHNLETT